MGYNNNNAGMHFVWYKGADLDDLNYYDRLASEEFRKKKEERRLAQEKEEENRIKNQQQPNKKSDHKIKIDTDQARVKAIDDKYFETGVNWFSNLFLIAYEKNIDIYDAVCECERLCEEDYRMRNAFSPLTELGKSMIFLKMLADKTGISMEEICSLSEEDVKERVYKQIDIIEKLWGSAWCMFEYAEDTMLSVKEEKLIESAIEIFELYPGVHPKNDDVSGNKKKVHMAYQFQKIYNGNDLKEPIYVFSGVLIRESGLFKELKDGFKYMYNGAEIYSEKKGKLADFYENTKKEFLDNDGYISDYLISYGEL